MHSQRSNTKAYIPFLFSLCIFFIMALSACAPTTQRGHYDSPWLNSDSPYQSGDLSPESLPQYTPIRDNDLASGRGPHAPQETLTAEQEQQAVDLAMGKAPPYYTVPDDVDTSDVNLPADTPKRAVKVAVLLPLTGKAADLGKAMSNAAQLALFDIAGSNITLITQDTKGTANGARIAAQNAVNKGAEIILGPLFSHSVKAVTPIARQNNLNVIAFSTDWSVTGNNVFTMGFLPFSQITRVVDYALQKNYAKIGVLIPQTPYGQAVYGTLQNTLSTQGLRPAKVARFVPGAASSNAVIRQFAEYDQRLGNKNIDAIDPDKAIAVQDIKNPTQPNSYNAILLPLGGSSLASTASLLTHYGVDTHQVQLIGTGLWDDQTSISEHALLGGWYAAPDPRMREDFEEKYYQTFSQTPPRLASLAYDATALAAVLAYTGLQNTGHPAFDRASIMSSHGFSGIDGVFRFRQDGLIERGLAILEVQRGEPRVIDPAPTRF